MIDFQQADIAKTFAALSHPKRVTILEFMLGQSPHTVTFGELQRATSIPASTLKHHLREMEHGSIVIRAPEGRSTRLKLDVPHLLGVLDYLTKRCCNNQAIDTKEDTNE